MVAKQPGVDSREEVSGRVQCMAKDRQRDSRSYGGVKEVQDGVSE